MRDSATYLAEIEMALVASPIVAEYRLVRSWANTDDGYIRVLPFDRVVLTPLIALQYSPVSLSYIITSPSL